MPDGRESESAMPSTRSDGITAASVADAQERLEQALEQAQNAIECEAYEAAAGLAIEAASVLSALSQRLVRERVERGGRP